MNWRKEDINVEGMKAAHLCQDVMNQEDRSRHKANYGRVVMYVEPELAGQCRSAGGPTHDIDKMAECAKNKFDNGWTSNRGFVPAPPPTTWSMPGMYCNPPDIGSKNSAQKLRDELTARIAAMKNNADSDNDRGSSGAASVERGDVPFHRFFLTAASPTSPQPTMTKPTAPIWRAE